MVSLLITDVRIFDGERVLDTGSVLIEHGRIARISPTSIPSHGPTVSAPHHTLLPGLIDAHIHADAANPVALPQSLRFGVTTVCDMHNEFPNVQKLRHQIATEGHCADLKTTSYAATVHMGWPMFVVLASHDTPEVREEMRAWPRLTDAESGRRYVRERVDEGVDYIKLMHESGKFIGVELPKPSLELQRAIVDEAHQHGLPVVAHSTCLADTLEILACDVDGLTHTIADQPPTDELVAAYQRRGAHCNPTLAAMASTTTEGMEVQARFAHDERIQHLIGPEERENMCACMAFSREHGKVANSFESVRKLKEAGIPIIVGSDAAGPAKGTAWGLSMHHELSLLVNECGFTPIEALRAATAVTADRLNFPDRGRIKEGLRADLLLVEGNPLQDIDHTLNLRGVWTHGTLCKAYEGKI
ncbi:Amidohydrolase family [Teratosphaeria destructans]|uniref:Amidohydrolase family n=1 Tax=Teratosphaeria destructans TaxID=418781 RepID=A0A9W7W3F5_9PEZI|nr:Amidohydrolase family [Teratosphaeria destructans]